MIDIVFLGNGAMMPTPQRWLSSFMMRVDGRIVLFDVGEGTQIPWQRTGWGFKRLDTICLSHWHADHVSGLPGVLYAAANAGRTDPITIIGPKGTRAIVSSAREMVPELPFDVRAADLTDGQSWQIGQLSVRVRLGLHRVPVLLYRFDLARGRAFLTDRALERGVPRNRWSDLVSGIDVVTDDEIFVSEDFLGPPRRGLALGVMTDSRPVELASAHFRNVDLLITEGTYGDPADFENAVRNKHMTFAEAATISRDAEAKRLVLTHFSPKMDNPADWLRTAREIMPNTDLAEPQQVFTLSFDKDPH